MADLVGDLLDTDGTDQAVFHLGPLVGVVPELVSRLADLMVEGYLADVVSDSAAVTAAWRASIREALTGRPVHQGPPWARS